MNRVGRLAIGLAALLGLAVAALWLVPPLLDWSRYRADVAGLASMALGRPVRIEGGMALRLLPQPTLEANRVTVETGPGSNITATTLRVQVALGPLLAGRIDAQDLVLRQAEILIPWPIAPGTLALRSPSWLSALSARLEDSRLMLGDIAVTGVNATLSIGDVSGSFFSAGRARAGGRDWAFTMRVSRPGGDGAVGMDVAIDGQGPSMGLGATVASQVLADGTMVGRIAMRGNDLAQVIPAPAVPFRLDGRLSFGEGLLAADELVGEIAGSPVQGAVSLRLLPNLRLDMALTASRMDLDSWGTALLNTARDGPMWRMPVSVDLSAEIGSLAGGVLRGLRGAFDISGETLKLRELRAQLPGDAALRLEGAIAFASRGVRFDGKAQLRAPSLRSTLDWAFAAWGGGALATQGLPPGTLRTAEIESAVTVEDGKAILSGIAGRVDGSALVANLALRPGPRPEIRALLALDRLDMETWLPNRVPSLTELGGGLGPLTLDVQLEAKAARWRGIEFAPFVLDMAAEPGRLVLRRLDAQAASVGVSASGTVLEGGRVAESRVEIRADRALAVFGALSLAEWAPRLGALRQAPLVVQMQAAGAPETLGVKLLAELGDLRLEMTPTLNLPAGRWTGAVAVRHPGAPRLAESFGLAAAEDWLGTGSFALQAAVSGQGTSIAAESFDIAAGSLRARGALRWEQAATPRLAGRVVAEVLPLPSPHFDMAVPLPVDAIQGWAGDVKLEVGEILLAQAPWMKRVAASLGLDHGVFRVAIERAELNGGTVAAAATMDGSVRPPAIAGDVKIEGVELYVPPFAAPIEIASGRIDARLRLAAAGFAPAGLLAGLTGDISATVRDGVLQGIDLARMAPRLEAADLAAALSGGNTPVNVLELQATIDRGSLMLRRAQASGPAGRIEVAGTVELARRLLDVRMGLVPAVEDPPEIGLRITGPVDRAQRVPELAAAVRWRTEHDR